jgi:hypothetical protein
MDLRVFEVAATVGADGVASVDVTDLVTVLFATFAEVVEFEAVRAKTLKLYDAPFVRPVILAVVCPETTNEFDVEYEFAAAVLY